MIEKTNSIFCKEDFIEYIKSLPRDYTDASIEDFVSGINYYREHDDFFDLKKRMSV